MRYLAADRIHSGLSFLPKDSVLVISEDGTIENILSTSEIDKTKIEFYKGIICPGFVNTHCHLELSYLKGKLKEGAGLHEFIREIEALKKPTDDEVIDAILDADREMTENGIVAVGDICNTSSTFYYKTRSSIRYHNFLEVYAFDPARAAAAFERGLNLAEELLLTGLHNFSIIPHAPYSSSLQLLKRITDYADDMDFILSIHNQENLDEDLLFKNKSGKILERLRQFGINTDFFVPTGKSSLKSILHMFPIDRKLLLVHNTFSSADDIEFATSYSRNIWWCICANANEYIENTQPDVAKLAELTNGKLTLGTDSYASNHQLSVAAEISSIMKKNSSVSLENILRWATINGAEFLGFEDTLGSFQKGKNPGFVLLEEKSKNEFVSERI